MRVITTIATLILVVINVIGLCQGQQDKEFMSHVKGIKDQFFMKKQLNCLLDRAPCDALGKNLKTLIPKLLANNCRECTQSTKNNFVKLRIFMMSNFPADWHAIVEHFSKRRRDSNPN
ncbi:hypothetical protein M0802_002749 [Mischocyttarus mexicanus]|nr:hypothetical protein M0802_002749 [Mischocyttarus mexicanus]